MRDGVRIAVDVILPEPVPAGGVPTILVMTRYWRATEGQKPGSGVVDRPPGRAATERGRGAANGRLDGLDGHRVCGYTGTGDDAGGRNGS
jgi:predicted acyl esterase